MIFGEQDTLFIVCVFFILLDGLRALTLLKGEYYLPGNVEGDDNKYFVDNVGAYDASAGLGTK